MSHKKRRFCAIIYVSRLCAAAALLGACAVLTGCNRGPEVEEGPPPGAKLTTQGKPAPPEALNKMGDAPPSDFPPPGQAMKGRRGSPGGSPGGSPAGSPAKTGGGATGGNN
jgi:hypothetical protein